MTADEEEDIVSSESSGTSFSEEKLAARFKSPKYSTLKLNPTQSLLVDHQPKTSSKNDLLKQGLGRHVDSRDL